MDASQKYQHRRAKQVRRNKIRLKLKSGTVNINLRNGFLIILIVSIRHTLKVTVDGKGNSVNIKTWPKSVL